jgi:hypothetical protein
MAFVGLSFEASGHELAAVVALQSVDALRIAVGWAWEVHVRSRVYHVYSSTGSILTLSTDYTKSELVQLH